MTDNHKLSEMRVACIVPTYNGRRDIERLFESLVGQSKTFDLIVVDSGSIDGTHEYLKPRLNRIVSISSKEFNHGGTRQMMVERFPEYDVYVFLTQDAYLENTKSIENLVAPFVDADVGAVCGRQLPHIDANPLSQHARLFNYPAVSHVKSINDSKKYGIKTAFMSNSFSAYRALALNEVGGFPSNVILSEDMFVASKMLIAGWKIAYAGDALCRHSHNYTLIEEFRRYFDQGVFHAQAPWIRSTFGSAGGEGLRFVISELTYIGFRNPILLINSLIRTLAKLLGYKLGQKERFFPVSLKQTLGMHRQFWK